MKKITILFSVLFFVSSLSYAEIINFKKINNNIGQIKEKDITIEQLELKIRELEQSIESKDTEIRELSYVSQKYKKLDLEQSKKLESEIKEKDLKIKNLEKSIQNKDNEINKLKTDYDNLKKKLGISNELVIKLSAGLSSTINSTGKYSYINDYFYPSGIFTEKVEDTESRIDIAAEFHHFFNKFIGIGGGISGILNVNEPVVFYNSFYFINPYISFKFKNLLINNDNIYLLFRVGTMLTMFADYETNIGYDAGIGYEYKSFVFELAYSTYSIHLLLSNNDGDKIYNEADIDMTNLKLSVGYKFNI